MKKICKICLLSAAAFLLLCGCGKLFDTKEEEISSSQDIAVSSSPETTEAAAAVTFEGLDMTGNTVSSDIFSASKLTMVNVWATYCNPCLREMPGLGELAGEYDPAEFQIIGIISDVQEGADQKTMDYASGLIQRTGADYTHLVLNESVYYALLTDVSAVPTTFFIDEEGVILDTVIGSMDKSTWEEKINALLEEQ